MKKKFMCLVLTAFLAAGLAAGCGTAPTDTGAESGNASDNNGTDSGTDSNDVSSEAGKASGEINVVSREDGSGTRGAFIELFGIEVKDDQGNKRDETYEEAIITNSTDVMLTTISEDANAIGYVSLGSLNETVKAVSIDGVEATAENIKNSSYAIARPFHLAYAGQLDETAQDFMNFILSAEGQEIVVNNGYVAVSDDAAAYEAAGVEGKITVAGSSSISPVMEKLKEAYQALNEGVEIEIQENDSTTGMTAAIDGTCDIGMASRELKDSETEAGLTAEVIAMDGIAVIVNNENAVEDLSVDTVNGIFRGEITSWDEIGE